MTRKHFKRAAEIISKVEDSQVRRGREPKVQDADVLGGVRAKGGTMTVMAFIVAGILLMCCEDWKSFSLGVLAGYLCL